MGARLFQCAKSPQTKIEYVKRTPIGIKAVTDFFFVTSTRKEDVFMCRGCPLQVRMRKDITNCVRLCPVTSDIGPRE